MSSGHNLHDATILEDIEDETTQMITGTSSVIGKVGKSPSLPSAANRAITAAAQSRTRSITGLGMFRSMRRKTKYDEEQAQEKGEDPVELRELHRRTRSWNKRRVNRVMDLRTNVLALH